jgi:hypothetical protein
MRNRAKIIGLDIHRTCDRKRRFRGKKLLCSVGYAFAKRARRQIKRKLILKYYCYKCTGWKEYLAPQVIGYVNPNEELGEGMTLVEN